MYVREAVGVATIASLRPTDGPAGSLGRRNAAQRTKGCITRLHLCKNCFSIVLDIPVKFATE